MYNTNIATKRSINTAVMICLVLVCKANTQSEGSSSEYSENVEHVCSKYHFFFNSPNNNWKEAEKCCKKRNYDGLVSMQTEREWVYFKNIATNITPELSPEQQRALTKERWFIGLRYVSQKWCWSSDTKACINQRTNDTGNWRWSAGEPNNLLTEHCVEMHQGGKYNNIKCTESFSYIGFICEKKVACSNVSEKYFFRSPKTTDRPFAREDKHQSSMAKPSTVFMESTIQSYQSTDGSHESPSFKATTKRSTQEKLLQAVFPSDRPNKGANITVIVSTTLAALLVVLLTVLGFILWRRRFHKNKGDRQENNEVDNSTRETSVPRQTSYNETYFLPNATSSSLPDETTIEGPHLYAVIDKTGNKDGHSSSNMSMPCQTMPHSDEHVLTFCPTLEPLLKAKEHIYENTTRKESKRKPPSYPTPYCARYKKPQEHLDDTEYVYAVVDETRAKKTNDEKTCGLVYTELELKPTQDEDETEVTAKGCVTIYSSIQEQH